MTKVKKEKQILLGDGSLCETTNYTDAIELLL